MSVNKHFFDGSAKHDISHLAPIQFEVTREAQGKNPAWTVAIEASFSWHCYTRTPDVGEDVNRVVDGSEVRCFCPDRYRYSLQLPSIIADLSEQKVFQTGKGNYVTIEIISDNGDTLEYEIYFTVNKASKRQPLKLYVESAYVPDDGAGRLFQRKNRQSIKFRVIVFNTKHGKEVSYRK